MAGGSLSITYVLSLIRGLDYTKVRSILTAYTVSKNKKITYLSVDKSVHCVMNVKGNVTDINRQIMENPKHSFPELLIFFRIIKFCLKLYRYIKT